MTNITLFGQIIQKLDRSIFNKLVKEHKTDKHEKGFNSWSHLVSMLFCHLAKSQSLRDISNGLRSATGNLNHLGNVHPPTKSNLGYQNKHRDWKLFKDYYFALLNQLGQQADWSANSGAKLRLHIGRADNRRRRHRSNSTRRGNYNNFCRRLCCSSRRVL